MMQNETMNEVSIEKRDEKILSRLRHERHHR